MNATYARNPWKPVLGLAAVTAAALTMALAVVLPATTQPSGDGAALLAARDALVPAAQAAVRAGAPQLVRAVGASDARCPVSSHAS